MSTPPAPPEDERARMRDEHGIGWHKRGGWYFRHAGTREMVYLGRVPAAQAVRETIRKRDARKSGIAADAAAEAKLRSLFVAEAGDLFLAHADDEHAVGKISDSHRAHYGKEIPAFVSQIGKGVRLADLSKMSAPDTIFRPARVAAMKRGVAAAEKHIVMARTFLDWCSRVRRFCPPPFYADAFDAPGKKEQHAAKKADRKAKGVANWTPAEVREIVEAAKATDVHRYAQVLLMLNGGMGATDLSLLEDADVDWARGCIHTDRSKTLVPRVVPLWDRTVEAMKASRAVRPEPVDAAHATRFFLTGKGKPLVTGGLNDDKDGKAGTDVIRNWFFNVLNPPKHEPTGKGRKRLPNLAHLKRHRAGAYTLRSVFVTLTAGESADLIAVILGHKFQNEVISFYLRGEVVQKLRHIVDRVHAEIWPT